MKTGLLIFSAGMLLAGCLMSGCDEDGSIDAVSGPTPYGKKTLPPEDDSYKVIGKSKGIDGYVIQYDDTLFRGGDPAESAGREELKKYGIATIVSITPTDLERRQAQKHGITLVELPFDRTSMPADTLKSFLNIMDEQKGSFYVHSHSGIHRAGILCMAWRIHRQNWDYDKAMIEFGRLGGSLKNDYVMLESIRQPPAQGDSL